MAHCDMIQAGEITAVVGDASRDGRGGPQYCGLWSLTSKHRVFNAFGNSYAGLIPGVIRGRAPVLEEVDEFTCGLVPRADQDYPVDARALYRVAPPNSIDHELVVCDRQDMRRPGCGFREVSYCSYLNCPEDPRLHFLSNGEWHRYISPTHGVKSNLAPSYLPESELEVWPDTSSWEKQTGQKRPFHWDRYERRFDQPFYYGRLGDMAVIFVFDTPRWLRFYCSPSGGGWSLLPDQTCPAWDFLWVIPESEYAVDRQYRFRLRLIYKRFVSDEDVLEEVKKAQEICGFEKV